MKERPILFTAPMVRALLDGSKTQTRRIVKGQEPAWTTFTDEEDTSGREFFMVCGERESSGLRPILDSIHCPYGQAVRRLRVRETFFAYGRWETRYSEKKKRDEWHFVDMTLECDRIYQYSADNPDVPLAMFRDSVTPQWWKRPAIFMPRAASRILLEVVSVRVERLQGISTDDCRAEGIGQCDGIGSTAHMLDLANRMGGAPSIDAITYATLWETINGLGSWDANPWVWVVEFKRVTP